MAMVWQGPKSRSALLSESLGKSLGEGLGNFTGNYLANKKLEGIMSDPKYKDKPLEEKWDALNRGLANFGQFGQQAIKRQMEVDQQGYKLQQERQQKSTDKLRGSAFNKAINKQPLTEQEQEAMTAEDWLNIGKHEQALDIQKLKTAGKAAPGGVTAQSVPPQIAQSIEQIINQNPNTTADQLGLEMDKNGIPRVYSNSYIENRRRDQETAQKSKIKSASEERSFHTGYSKKAVEEADQLRASLPKKESALNFARDAVETGNQSYFSPDKLADATGIDLFRTAKGAQLITAGKENLLSNMARTSARAQNMWFEQRLNTMFPKIGQSKEANLTVQEMLEGEEAMDKAYLKEFDRLAKEDEENFGYERKDIAKRARQGVEPINKHIMDRSSFRMKEIEEQEKGLNKLKSEVGKVVPKGTPLTMAMAKLYVDKFGKDQALKVAQKNGYKIPSIEEYQSYQMRPKEFSEEL